MCSDNCGDCNGCYKPVDQPVTPPPLPDVDNLVEAAREHAELLSDLLTAAMAMEVSDERLQTCMTGITPAQWRERLNRIGYMADHIWDYLGDLRCYTACTLSPEHEPRGGAA